MRIGLFGPVTAGPDGVLLRGALARLALDTGRVVAKDVLVDAPRFARKAQADLARAQKEIARRRKGSANREKSRRKVARAHLRVADTRRDRLHDHVRALPCADVIAPLQSYVRGLDAGSVPAAGSDATLAAASGPSLDSASATSRA